MLYAALSLAMIEIFSTTKCKDCRVLNKIYFMKSFEIDNAFAEKESIYKTILDFISVCPSKLMQVLTSFPETLSIHIYWFQDK